jgi:hypothetical protein
MATTQAESDEDLKAGAGEPMYFRAPDELRESIERVRLAERRPTLSNVIVVLLEESLALRRAQGRPA